MKKTIAAIALGSRPCSPSPPSPPAAAETTARGNSVDALVENYGYQWEDTSAPILNEKGAQEISFRIYSSKNASAKYYKHGHHSGRSMRTPTSSSSGRTSPSPSTRSRRTSSSATPTTAPTPIYHAGMSASEIIRYASRKVLLPSATISNICPTSAASLRSVPTSASRSPTSRTARSTPCPASRRWGFYRIPTFCSSTRTGTLEAIEAGAVSGLTAEDVKDGIRLTAAQMESLLTYFLNNDMNGNGQNDERPMTFVYNNWQGNQCDLYGMFGLNDNTDHRVIVDGKVTYTVLDDRFKEATQFINGWVEKGLIDEVSFEQTQDNFLANGKGTELYGAFYWWESETVVSNPENYVVCQPLVGPNGDQTICVSNNPEVGTGEVVVFAGTPNVEVLLTYFDRYYDPMISAQINYGPIGIVYEEELDENGMLVQKEVPEGKTADELRLENAPLGICYLSDYAWENVVHMEPRARLRLERLEAYATPYVPEGVQPVSQPSVHAGGAQHAHPLRDQHRQLHQPAPHHLAERRPHRRRLGGLQDRAPEHARRLGEVQKVYQAAYDRYVGPKTEETFMKKTFALLLASALSLGALAGLHPCRVR